MLKALLYLVLLSTDLVLASSNENSTSVDFRRSADDELIPTTSSFVSTTERLNSTTSGDVYFSSVSPGYSPNGSHHRPTGPYTGPTAKSNSTEELLPYILNMIKTKSDSRLRPKIGRDPVIVYTDMFVLDIGDISEADMEFRVMFFYRQYWQDTRLAYDYTGYNKRLALNARMVDYMWIPDIYFVNEKSGIKHDLTKQNEVVRVWPDGRVFHSIRLSMTASCPMKLHSYPMDKQTCKLSFESFSYPSTELIFKWNKNRGNKEVQVSDELQIPQFILTEYKTTSEFANFTTGSYSRLTVLFRFERSIGFFLIQTYIPAYLIVMLSWIAFWINHTSTPARIGLGITTVLTMTTLTNSARASLPKVSYVKSIEWFLIMCFLYVFMSLVEYGCVSYEVNRKLKKGVRLPVEAEQEQQTKEPEKQQNVMYVMDKEQSANGNSKLRPVFSFRSRQKATQLIKQRSFSQKEIEGMEPLTDRYCRVLFPVSFLVFNIIYWILSYNGVSP